MPGRVCATASEGACFILEVQSRLKIVNNVFPNPSRLKTFEDLDLQCSFTVKLQKCLVDYGLWRE